MVGEIWKKMSKKSYESNNEKKIEKHSSRHSSEYMNAVLLPLMVLPWILIIASLSDGNIWLTEDISCDPVLVVRVGRRNICPLVLLLQLSESRFPLRPQNREVLLPKTEGGLGLLNSCGPWGAWGLHLGNSWYCLLPESRTYSAALVGRHQLYLEL